MPIHKQETTLMGPFELGEKLGTTLTYRARDTRDNREVVLRVLPAYRHTEEAVARFRREIDAERALDHPNLCQFYTHGECVLQEGEHVGAAGASLGEGRVQYFAREFLEGKALQWKVKFEPMSVTDAIFVAKQICSGLAAIHDAGLVHRNVSSRTIFLTDDRQVKITDFGGVKELTEQAKLYKTAPGQVVGSAGYLAPEQFRGGDVDHRSDLFALGVVLYEMIAGKRPFPEDLLGYVRAIEQGGAFAPLAECADGVPLGLDSLVEKLLKVDPAERYNSAAEVTAALERFSAQAERDDLGIHGLTLGEWELEARLGDSLTYRARGGTGGLAVLRVVAFEREGREAVTRFHRELEVRRNVQHLSLGDYFADGTANANHPEFGFSHTKIGWIACEYLEGESLSTALLYRTFTPTLAIKTALEVLEGLDVLHQYGAIHRGISCRTVFRTKGGVTKITDLSTVKVAVSHEPSVHLSGGAFETAVGVKIGTVGAMAPEQFENRKIDARADLFSVGALLYELMSGRKPFPVLSRFAYIEAVSSELPPAPLHGDIEGVPAELDTVVNKLLSYRPENRYESATEAARALAGCLAHV